MAEHRERRSQPLVEALTGLEQRVEGGVGQVAQPLRVAVSGGMISPTIGETLAMLGRDRTLARIRRCLTSANRPP